MLNILQGAKQQKTDQRRTAINKSLIHMEARIGGKLFGPIPKGHRREFFCLDEHTWVWHEEWLDKNSQRHMVTTRYDVRSNAVLKSQGNNSYQKLTDQEAKNFFKAIALYGQKIDAEYAKILSAA